MQSNISSFTWSPECPSDVCDIPQNTLGLMLSKGPSLSDTERLSHYHQVEPCSTLSTEGLPFTGLADLKRKIHKTKCTKFSKLLAAPVFS